MEAARKKPTKTKTGIVQRPDIFGFHDYRLFLDEWFHYLKSRKLFSSLRTLADQSGLSVSYLPMVLSGKRKISEEAIDKVIPRLHLYPREESYFRLLCRIAHSETVGESAENYGKTRRFQIYQSRNPKEARVFGYMSQWVHVVIREMAGLPGFRLEAGWIHERLAYKVPYKAVADAIEFLTQNKFVNVEEGGHISLPDQHIECVNQIFKLALAQYHKQMFAKVGDAIDVFPSEKRNVKGVTMALSPEGARKMKGILDRAYEELLKLAASDRGPKAVYHAGLMGIPMTCDASDLMENTDISTEGESGDSSEEN